MVEWRRGTCNLSMTEAISLDEAGALPSIRLHPSVVMNILNSYMRRSDRKARVIGTLMGTVKEGKIEILGTVFSLELPRKQSLSRMYV